MRSLHELYKILWEKIKDKKRIHGLCCEIRDMYDDLFISESEYIELTTHFMSQKHNHPEFKTEEKNWNFNLSNNYWWTFQEDYNPINRKAFILKMIEITKE
jgi:hypothetical protein